MTNILYFHNTLRDDDDDDSVSVSTTTETETEEESPAASRLHTPLHHRHLGVVSVSSVAAIGAWIPTAPLGVNTVDDSELDCDSSETFSSNSISPAPQSDFGKLEYPCSKRFSFKELESATRNFHHDGALGERSFGRVFKGWIDEKKLTATEPGEGIAVAVEMLSELSLRGHDEWWAEIKYLGRLYHPNLVRLLGYCIDNDHLLVYEFMPRGSLYSHLFKKDSPPLSWSVRMKIALGAAKGLSFLHSASVNVMHRDFKSSDILLDMNYNAKISDFGLAKDGPTSYKSHVSTLVMGTYGYAAPEYIATGHLTAKSDVYSFGAVFLEMLTGQRAFDTKRPAGDRNLVKLAKPYLKHRRKMYDIADSRLEGQYILEGFRKAANLALKCLSLKGTSRPNMDEVVNVLEQF